MRDVYIVEAVRTPIGKGGKPGGVLHNIRPDDLAALTLKELVKRAGIDPGRVEDVVLGCVTQTGEQGLNIARAAVLLAGFPIEVPGTSINRQCGSSQQAIHFASQAIAAGDMDLVIAGGVESMSRVPIFADVGYKGKGNSFAKEGPGTYWNPNRNYPFDLVFQHQSAEMLAEKWQISREEMDRFSCESHLKAARATREGCFGREIIPLETEKGLVTQDEGIRFEPDLEKMGRLPGVFGTDHITAGNSSQESDGASAVLLASRPAVWELGLKPRARILARVSVASDPVLMLEGPISATPKVLKKAGLKLEDIDLIEINEAFASAVLAWAKALKPEMGRVNVNGGAIALGHPLGASGARLMTTLLHELERRGKQYGLQTMCIGYGMATATIIERLD